MGKQFYPQVSLNTVDLLAWDISGQEVLSEYQSRTPMMMASIFLIQPLTLAIKTHNSSLFCTLSCAWVYELKACDALCTCVLVFVFSNISFFAKN